MVYLKTTDTCQLDCKHCFTNGKNGAKGWFDEVKTVDFFKRLKQKFPHYNNANISFHGGEPMLCPIEKMEYAYENIKDLWVNLTWGIQTNLTYNLDQRKIDFMGKISDTSIGTSYDSNIRWTTINQKLLWERNVRTLVDAGFDITVMVCIDKDLISRDPRYILDYLIDLGVRYVNFERITLNGNATRNMDHIPTNKEIDDWIYKLWIVTKNENYNDRILNMFFESILSGVVYGTFNGCRSRECEQKILTINANGTIGGCPNNAVNNTFGTINDDIDTIIYSPDRMCLIQTETMRNDICYSCPVYDICNGDCHQLNWDGDVCASPKSMMIDAKNTDINIIKRVLGDMMATEGTDL